VDHFTLCKKIINEESVNRHSLFGLPFSGIDGLGGMGSGAHTLSETLNLKTFKDLTKRAAILIYRLTR